MAKGSSNGGGLWLFFAVVLYAVLVATGAVPNPLPGVWEWVNRERPIAPDLAWQERLSGRPSAVVTAGDHFAILLGTSAELRQTGTGIRTAPRSGQDWPASWMVVAGTGSDAVVVTGTLLSHGYEMRDAGTGGLIHRDEEAVAVWGYQDALLDVRCFAPQECELRAYPPGSPEPRWRTDLPGISVDLLAGAPHLAGARRVLPRRVDATVSGPEPMPALIGLPVDQRVVVVETAGGQVLRELSPRRDEQLSVIDGRVVSSIVTSRDGICAVEVTGRDAYTDQVVWGPHPYHLRTVSGAGCQQRDRPVAAGSALLAVAPDGLDLVIDAYGGRVLWTAGEGERIVGLHGGLALVRAADAAALRVVDLNAATVLWQRAVDPEAEAAITGCGVVLLDRNPDRVILLGSTGGHELIAARTAGRVRACAPGGLVLGDGRSIGLARYAGPPGNAPLP